MSTLGDVRLVFLGFNEEMIARNILELVKEAKEDKAIEVADWALVRKDESGKVKIEGDKSVDPGAEPRGAVRWWCRAWCWRRSRGRSAWPPSRAARRSAPSPPGSTTAA